MKEWKRRVYRFWGPWILLELYGSKSYKVDLMVEGEKNVEFKFNSDKGEEGNNPLIDDECSG